jgi:hypothetical protein
MTYKFETAGTYKLEIRSHSSADDYYTLSINKSMNKPQSSIPLLDYSRRLGRYNGRQPVSYVGCRGRRDLLYPRRE